MKEVNKEFEAKVTELIESLRINLQNDGGDMELVKIDGKKVFLRLQGACGSCPHAQVTLKDGIERVLREQLDPEIVVERA